MVKQRKKIVIFHYHLKRGGVTSVIREQVAALADDADVLILAGEPPEEYIHDNVTVIPELRYSTATDGPVNACHLADKVSDAVTRYFGTRCDVLHFHNPILAKNLHLLRVIKILAARGFAVFLQIHDFPEDGRVGSCIREEYPADVHFGVINSRDHGYLLSAGLKPEGLHLLPNCVRELPDGGGDFRDNHLLLYPVRAIRGKNIGEVLLLSLFLNDLDYIGVSLPALSRNDWQSYEDWKIFARDNGLPVRFDLGTKYQFRELIAISKCFLTTSIAEGFGFAFLESWTCGRPLWGRKIPGICDDFTAGGLNLDGLYERFLVPRDRVDLKSFLKKLEGELKHIEKYYDVSLDARAVSDNIRTAIEGEYIDFGLLSEKNQAAIIREAADDERLRRTIFEANEKLALLSVNAFDESVLQRNRDVVARRWSRGEYGKTLSAVYEKVISVQVRHTIDKVKLLTSFLQPQHLSLLKWGSYGGSKP